MNSLLSEKIKIRSSNINILRFICAIAVILCHSYAITLNHVDFVEAFNNGQCNLGGIAVSVFFFLSGLYVTKSLERESSVLMFMKKRCIRIFPQLWIVVLASVILGAFISTYSVGIYLTSKETYLYLLNGVLLPVHNLPGVFIGNPYQTVNGPLWTMPVEFVCYIGLALIALVSKSLFKMEKKRVTFDLVAFLVLAVLFVLFLIRAPKSMLFTAVRPMLIFYEGVLFYDFREKVKLNPIVGAVLLICLVALMKTQTFNIGLVILFPYAFLSLTLGMPQFKYNSTILLTSYEMYLVGWPIQQIVMSVAGEMSPFMNFAISLPLDLVFGYVVYKCNDIIMNKNK